MSPHSGHIQATAVWLCSCATIKLKIVPCKLPELFPGCFRRFDDDKLNQTRLWNNSLGSAEGGIKKKLAWFNGHMQKIMLSRPPKTTFLRIVFYHDVFFSLLPWWKPRLSASVYLCLVKVPKIWLEQFWPTANSVSEGVAIRNRTMKLIEYLQFMFSYCESAGVGL